MSHRQIAACLIFVLAAALCVQEYGVSAVCLRNLIFLGALLYLSMVDLQHYMIPDKALLAAVLAWFGTIPFAYDAYGGIFGVLGSVMSAVVYGGGILLFTLVMDRLLQKETMGGGDIKLFAVTGLYLGLLKAMFAMFLACVFGLCFAFLRRKSETPQMPFGPSIAAACWVMLLYGDIVQAWYMTLMF